MQRIRDRAVGIGLEQHLDCSAAARLSRQMERGHTLAVIGPAEAAAGVRIGAELEEPPYRLDPAVHRRPRERRPAVGIRVEAGAELGEPRDRLDPIALRSPDERLVEDLLRIVARLPGRKTAVRPVERAVQAGRLRPSQLIDQVDAAEPRRDAQVPRLFAEQPDDLTMPPEERGDERRAPVTSCAQTGICACLECQPGERRSRLPQPAWCRIVQP